MAADNSPGEVLEQAFQDLCQAKAKINYMLTKRRVSRTLIQEAVEQVKSATISLETLIGPGGDREG